MNFILFLVYLIANLFLFLFIYKKVQTYRSNQKEYDHIEIKTNKDNKEWFYELLDKLNIKGHAYQVIGKDYNHYYKHDLKIVYLGKDFFYHKTIYSIYAIFFNISLIKLFQNENNIFNKYLKYNNYYIWIFILSFFGSFLTFINGLMISGLIFMIVYIACIIVEFYLANKLVKEFILLIEEFLPELTEEEKQIMKQFVKSENFYFFSVFINKRKENK